MPKIASLGALSSRGFGEFAQQTSATYIEDVFSTYLYTGNGTYTPKTGVNTIQNGIDLSTKGGLVWAKTRSNGATNNVLFDTARGVSKVLITDSTNPQSTYAGYGVTSFNTNGFTLEGNLFGENRDTWTEVSWTFRKQPKFFDVATFTSNSSGGATVSHNLGSSPGMVIVKATGATENWWVWHRSLANTQYLVLNTTNAIQSGLATITVSSTDVVFSNAWLSNSTAYVMYVFAHDAGGFGLDGTQNVISCGSFTTDGSGNASVTLGYEPQYVLWKSRSVAGNWFVTDIMRGASVTNTVRLFPNLSDAESSAGVPIVVPNATGFSVANSPNSTAYVYMAIRRGPMKVPTDATTVFTPQARTGTGSNTTTSVSAAPIDLFINANRAVVDVNDWAVFDRLRGPPPYLFTYSTAAEATSFPLLAIGQTGVTFSGGYWNSSGASYITYNFKRAPSFMDVVCWTVTSSSDLRVSHNLGVAPELIIQKARSSVDNWNVYAASEGVNKYLRFNLTNASTSFSGAWGTAPTASTFGVNTGVFYSVGQTVVSYLFSSCPGVSKVGSYTGTGATQTISCGFTGGARYVLIKRTDSTGDWWVWDTARGMVAGTDPRLAFNSTAAETNANWVYTTTGGFQIVTSDATVNASGGTYIYLAIA